VSVQTILAALHISLRSSDALFQLTVSGWFALDFTLAELKSLRKRQPFDFRDHTFDGQFTIPTLEEHITVAKSSPRPVAIYPELKYPEWINSVITLRNSSQRFEDIVLQVLEKYQTVRCFFEALFVIWLQLIILLHIIAILSSSLLYKLNPILLTLRSEVKNYFGLSMIQSMVQNVQFVTPIIDASPL